MVIIFDLEIIYYSKEQTLFYPIQSLHLIKTNRVEDKNSISGYSVTRDYSLLLEFLEIPIQQFVIDHRTNIQ